MLSLLTACLFDPLGLYSKNIHRAISKTSWCPCVEPEKPFGPLSSSFKVKSFKYNSIDFRYYERPSNILFSSYRKRIIVLIPSPILSTLDSAEILKTQVTRILKENPHSRIMIFHFGHNFQKHGSQFWTPAQPLSYVVDARPSDLSSGSLHHHFGSAPYWDFMATAWIGLMRALMLERTDETVELVALDEFAALVPLLSLKHWYSFSKSFVTQIAILKAKHDTLSLTTNSMLSIPFAPLSVPLFYSCLASLSYLCHGWLPARALAEPMIKAVFSIVFGLAPFAERALCSKQLASSHPNTFLWLALFVGRRRKLAQYYSSFYHRNTGPQHAMSSPESLPGSMDTKGESSSTLGPRSGSPSLAFSSYSSLGSGLEPDSWLALLQAQIDIGKRCLYSFKTTVVPYFYAMLPSLLDNADAFDMTLRTNIGILEEDHRLGWIESTD